MERDSAEDLAGFVATLDAAAFPAARSAALDDLIDTVACAAAGRSADGAGQVLKLLADWGGKPESALWFHGLRVPAPEAALFNGLIAHAVEFDDTHDDAILHAGITVVPAVLAVAERRGRLSGSELMAAIIVGVETACRIAMATSLGPGESGWLLTPLCGTFGAAAGAARALGLDADRTIHALGLAYAQASGNGQATIDGALAKRLQPGLASRAGTLAAIMAEAGLTGARQALEGRRGFFNVYQHGQFDRNRLLDGLGERFAVESLSYKPYPCCRWTHSSIEAALEFRRNSGIASANIATIRATVNRQAFFSTGDPIAIKCRPRNVVDSQFSIPYAVACALVDGRVGLDHFSDTARQREDLLEIAARVEVIASDDWPQGAARSISPSRLLITLNNGNAVEETVMRPGGGPGDAATSALIRKKLLDCTRGAGFGEEASERLLADLETITASDNVCPTIRRMGGLLPAGEKK